MLCIGPGKLKSKQKVVKISASKSIKDCLSMDFFSSSVSKLIILVKLGEIGYSSFAAMSMEIVASRHI